MTTFPIGKVDTTATDREITLKEGWNLIGYCSGYKTSLAQESFMKGLAKLVGSVGVGLSAFFAGANYSGNNNMARGDVIELWNLSESSGVAGYENTLDMSSNPGSDVEYDSPSEDKALIIYSAPEGIPIKTNYTQYPQLGETFTYFLCIHDQGGSGVDAFNTIKLGNYNLLTNPNYVTDFRYELSVDTTDDYPRSGLLSEIWNMADHKLGPWKVKGEEGELYGTFTITAVGVPEPTGLGLAGLAGLAGAGYLAHMRRREDE